MCLMKRVIWLVLALTLILILNIMPVYAQDPLEGAEVVFSNEGGFYKKGFYLELKAQAGAKIYYTLDGSTPSEKSLVYEKPILIEAPSLEEAPLSNAVSDNPWWRPNSVFNARVVRAMAVYPNGQKSKVVTNTYFIHEDMENVFKTPVMSVSIEPEDFAGKEKGMYTNFYNESLRPQCFVEYYEADGTLGFKHSAEVRISGHAARASRKKSLRFNFTKGEYENDGKLLNYDLFPDARENYVNQDKKVGKHAKVTARISDWEQSTIRESLTERIAQFLRPETFSTVNVALFINGEFWGQYELREQLDNHYIAQHYDEIKKDDVVMLSFDWDTKNPGYKDTHPLFRVTYDEGPDGEEEKYFNDFMEIYTLITGGRITEPEIFEKVKRRLDIDNFIDYFAVYFFTDNIDWPGNNIKMWRTTDEPTENPEVYAKDGKWRFAVHDFDIAYANVDSNTLFYFTTPPAPADARVPQWAADMIKSLLSNEEFAQKFAARYSTYAGTVFSTERTTKILDYLVERAEAGLKNDFLRWNLNIRFRRVNRNPQQPPQNNQQNQQEQPQFEVDMDVIKNWKEGPIAYLRRFLEQRPQKSLKFLEEYYTKELKKEGGFTKISFMANPQEGYFDISGARINPEAYGDKLAYSFTSQYLNNMPVEVNFNYYDKKPLYIEINNNGDINRIEDTSFTYVPKGGEVSIKAVYKNDEIIILRDNVSIEGGKILVDATVVNNSDKSQDAIVFVLVYDKDNKLMGISSKKVEDLLSSEALSFSLDLNDEDDITYKILAQII